MPSIRSSECLDWRDTNTAASSASLRLSVYWWTISSGYPDIRMWIRAMLRQAPPTALKVLAEKAPAMGFSAWAVAARVRSGSKRPPCDTENGPSGSVTPRQGSPSLSRRDLKAGAAQVAHQSAGIR